MRRELAEETGIEVNVLELIEVFERIDLDGEGKAQISLRGAGLSVRAVGGEARAGSDVTEVAWATPAELIAIFADGSRHTRDPQSV